MSYAGDGVPLKVPLNIETTTLLPVKKRYITILADLQWSSVTLCDNYLTTTLISTERKKNHAIVPVYMPLNSEK